MSEIPAGIVPGPTDIRRAAALLIHANPNATNAAGIAAIVDELKADLRITEALVAVALVAYASPQPLGTPAGQAGLVNVVNTHASEEGKQQ